MSTGPPPAVQQAFELAGTPVRLDGGRGTSWRVGDAVLKPLDMAEDELAWLAKTYERLACDGFRVAAPLRAAGRALVVDGWTATRAVSGRHEQGRWAEIIAVGERFHTTLAFDDELPPAILDFSPYWRPAPYAAAIVVADALTWEEADETVLDAVAHIEDFEQYLLRALIFRLVVARILGDDDDRFAWPIEAACRLVTKTK